MHTDEIIERTKTALAYLEDGARETGLRMLREIADTEYLPSEYELEMRGKSLGETIIERNHGVRLAALFDLAAALMRGNPGEFKAGYSAASGLLAAAELLHLNTQERTELAEAFSSVTAARRAS